MVDRLKVILFQSLKVKYKGKKLDQFKTTWFRKQNPVSNMNCHYVLVHVQMYVHCAGLSNCCL